ncbi:ATP-dependent Clp protease adapter ClpS [Limibaculum sp. M0105]|uniref:ATP-dependent Clp protease adapter protein ClpS n=1 Tax=Thermohalobaculum xanthum TaxID=2753746 RepID=A0A8J7M6P3_9RHOB|nr:ATP-dependent Clp protease adapter ClpS [Thermohalobaculum xanthum]MBK0398715.1 ATP-dependent Clp protease adapter ClpS [Thermohalobaculum xanthum]
MTPDADLLEHAADSLPQGIGAAQVRAASEGDDGDDGDDGGRGKTGIAVKAKPKTKRPSLYKVLMLNDDYTPMEFVVYVLQRFFNMDHGRAVDIMLTVHNKGVAVVGVYPFEIAETKVTQVMDCARSNQHPLQCTMEKE